MPVPKRKTSRAVRDSRRAGNNNVTAPTVNECPQCHQPKVPHRVCPSCGYYNGREVVETE
jgi:large subunit ribosomal protein L32